MTTAETGDKQRPLTALLRTLAYSADGNVGESVLRGFLAPSGARFVLVHVIHDLDLALVAHAGVQSSVAELYSKVPLTVQTPMTEVLRTGDDLVMNAHDWASSYPLGALLSRELGEGQSVLMVNGLRRAGIPTGAVTIGYSQAPDDTGEFRDRLDSLTDALALWAGGVGLAAPSAQLTIAEAVSPRQREIIALVSEGFTNPQIADSVEVSVATVKAELAWLFTLLGAKRRSELPARAIRAGI